MHVVSWLSANFRRVEECIAESPTFAKFGINSSIVVTCDVSAIAIGANLAERQHGAEKLVAFVSRTLSLTERRYSASELEGWSAYGTVSTKLSS